jgi:hypothetical protein
LLAASSQSAGSDAAADRQPTASPIKHLIVLIGENRSFDHTFATYTPRSGDSIKNLLSQGIVKADGSPGPNVGLARQFKQQPVNGQFRDKFFISLPNGQKTPYQTLPVPGLNVAPNAQQDVANFATQGVIPPFLTSTPQSVLAGLEPSLDADDLNLLTTGAAIGLSENPNLLAQDVDTRIANFDHLPNGPFPLKGGALPYDSYTGDTTHRLFEMWQQSDCSGYYDSGYIQPLDFFGDGPRIPLIVVSKYTQGGRVNHSYADHVSITKFIERNWHLKPLTERSRDNFPNPRAERDNPYVAVNSPALSDLFDLFDFDHDSH